VRTSFAIVWIADVAAVVAAVSVAGAPLPTDAVYGAIVVILSVPRRVPISPRLYTQIGRLGVAAILPAFALVAWLGATSAWHLALDTFVALVVARSLAHGALRTLRRRGWLSERAVIVGTGETGRLVANLLIEHPELGIVPIGFLDGSPRLEAAPLPVLRGAAELVATVERVAATRVLVCFPVEPDRDLVGVLRELRSQRVDVCMVPRLQELGSNIPRSALDEVFGVPMLPMRGASPSLAGRLGKRTFDVVVGSTLLVALAPLLAASALLVRIRIGSPVLFRQQRVTGAGRTSSILKLRTLPVHHRADTTWAVPDSGVTRLGRWLRASHVDELPQLLNVLRGDMSLVGPRPERPFFDEQFRREIPEYEDRTRVPAGLTGWSQIHGLHGDTSIRERVRFDNQYIETWTPWLDVVILARTAALVLRTAGRAQR
jgi:exopolysaccharide biosynthesis polyprenyl glycosylphosphotransferase